MATYWEKLQDPRWQKKRLQIMERDAFKCVICRSDASMLHVHHGYYARGVDPWDYDDETLYTLCEDHHKAEQELLEEIHLGIALLSNYLTYDQRSRIPQLIDDIMWANRLAKESEEIRQEVLKELSESMGYVIPSFLTRQLGSILSMPSGSMEEDIALGMGCSA